MIGINYEVKIPRGLKKKSSRADMEQAKTYIHRYVREELKSRENYHFQVGNISPDPKSEEPLQEGWKFRKYKTGILAANGLQKAIGIYNGSKPYCSKYIQSGSPKNWPANKPKKMHFWYQGEEMFRYCVGGIVRYGAASNQLRSDIELAGKFGIERGQKAFSRYMKGKYG